MEKNVVGLILITLANIKPHAVLLNAIEVSINRC